VGPADDGQDGDHDQVVQLVNHVVARPRVGHVGEVAQKTPGGGSGVHARAPSCERQWLPKTRAATDRPNYGMRPVRPNRQWKMQWPWWSGADCVEQGGVLVQIATQCCTTAPSEQKVPGTFFGRYERACPTPL